MQHQKSCLKNEKLKANNIEPNAVPPLAISRIFLSMRLNLPEDAELFPLERIPKKIKSSFVTECSHLEQFWLILIPELPYSAINLKGRVPYLIYVVLHILSRYIFFSLETREVINLEDIFHNKNVSTSVYQKSSSLSPTWPRK